MSAQYPRTRSMPLSGSVNGVSINTTSGVNTDMSRSRLLRSQPWPNVSMRDRPSRRVVLTWSSDKPDERSAFSMKLNLHAFMGACATIVVVWPLDPWVRALADMVSGGGRTGLGAWLAGVPSRLSSNRRDWVAVGEVATGWNIRPRYQQRRQLDHWGVLIS